MKRYPMASSTDSDRSSTIRVSGVILSICSADEKRRYNVTSSLILTPRPEYLDPDFWIHAVVSPFELQEPHISHPMFFALFCFSWYAISGGKDILFVKLHEQQNLFSWLMNGCCWKIVEVCTATMKDMVPFLPRDCSDNSLHFKHSKLWLICNIILWLLRPLFSDKWVCMLSLFSDRQIGQV